MSRQRLQELENQYYASESQTEKIKIENPIIQSEIRQAEKQLTDLRYSKSINEAKLREQNTHYTQILDKVWNENKILKDDIVKKENTFNIFTKLLSEYTEYVPIIQAISSEPTSNIELAGQLSSALSNTNISDI